MDSHRARERPGLFAALTLTTVAVVIAVEVWRARLLVPTWTFGLVGVPFLAFSAYLQIHRDDAIGREGRWVDWWTVPHAIAGVLFGLTDLGLVWVGALVLAWELVEIVARIFEHPTNRITDIAVALAGWSVAQLALTGGLRTF